MFVHLEKYITNWSDFLAFEKNYSNNTLDAYLTDLRNFLNFLNHYNNKDTNIQDLQECKVRDFRAWLSFRINNNFSHSSNARALSVIKSFYRYLNKNFDLDAQNIFNVRSPKKEKLLPKAIEVSDAYELSSLIDDSNWIGARNKALLILIYGTGLRISEALSLKNNIDNVINVTGKGNKERQLPILPAVKQAIDHYINLCPYQLNEFLFIGEKGKKLQPAIFQKEIRNIRNILGLSDKVTPHAFRHSFATHLLNNGADLKSIQELLGHESLITTQIYTKLDSKKLLEEYNKYS